MLEAELFYDNLKSGGAMFEIRNPDEQIPRLSNDEYSSFFLLETDLIEYVRAVNILDAVMAQLLYQGHILPRTNLLELDRLLTSVDDIDLDLELPVHYRAQCLSAITTLTMRRLVITMDMCHKLVKVVRNEVQRQQICLM